MVLPWFFDVMLAVFIILFKYVYTDIYQFSTIKYQFINDLFFDTKNQCYSFVLNSFKRKLQNNIW